MDGIEPWWWWVGAGIVLAALEMVVPGVYLIWLALAAIVTGVLALVGSPLVLQIVSFVFLALIFAYSAKRVLRDKPIESADPLMNNRAGRLIGQSAVVTQAIDGGEGRVRVADGEWLASGPDCPAGTRVRIAGANGVCLSVEALELPPPPGGVV
jgi:membrane protein implicated in regulation of membrane protease activity